MSKEKSKDKPAKERVVQTSGSRKRAVARATLKKGTGLVRINNVPLESYSHKYAQLKIREPLVLAGDLSNTVDIRVDTFGGGVSGQAEAVRLAIASALVEYSKDKKLKELYLSYDRHLLVADTRRAESSKPNNSKPRHARQTSYR